MDAQVGDHVVVDGGMVTLDVLEKAGPDVRCQVADPGIILSRANLTFRRDGVIVRARNSMLPVLSSKVCSLYFGLNLYEIMPSAHCAYTSCLFICQCHVCIVAGLSPACCIDILARRLELSRQ